MTRSRIHWGATCLLPILTLLLCARHNEEHSWNNPLDPNGTNWFPPTISAMADTTVAVKDSVRLHAKGVSSHDSLAGYVWRLGADTVLASADTIGLWVVPVRDSGRCTLTVVAVDSVGRQSLRDTVVIQVKTYRPVMAAMSDTSVWISDTVRLHAAASDSNGRIMRYFWARDGVHFADTTADSVLTLRFASVGNWRVKVYAQDDDSLLSLVDSIGVRALSDTPTVVAMPDTGVSVFDTVTLRVSGTDPNGTVVMYLWSACGLTSAGSTTDITRRYTFTTTDTGRRVVYVRAVDNDGRTSHPDSIVITVRLDAPVVVPMNDTAVIPLDSFTIWARARDTNGVVRKFYWALDGSTFADSTDSGAVRAAYASTGLHLVMVKARDDDGFFSTAAAIKITALSDTPAVIMMRDTSVSVNTTVLVTARGVSRYGSIQKYFWATDGLTYADSTTIGSMSFASDQIGTHLILVKVRDNVGLYSPPDTLNLRVTQ
jgi:hypothetical protein